MTDHSAPGTVGPSRLAGNVAALTVSRIFASGLLLVWQIALARALGTTVYGIYASISAMMAIAATIPDLGTGVIFVRDVARRPADSGRYLGATLVLQSALGMLAYGGLLAAGLFIGYDARLLALLAFVGLNLFVDALGTIGHNQFVSSERMGWTAAIGSAHVALLVSLGVAALRSGGGLWTIYAAVTVAGVARTVSYWIGLRRHGWKPVFPVDRALVRRLLAAGLPLGTAALLSLAFLHGDKLLAMAIVGPEGTGQLMAAFVVVFGVVDLISATVLVAVFPAMARLRSSADRRSFDAALRHLLFFPVLLGLPMAASVAIFALPVTTLVFGGGFADAAAVLTVLGWVIVMRMVHAVLAQALTVEDRQTRVLTTRSAGLLVNLVLTLSLLPRVGIVGAAIGTMAGEAVIVIMMLRQLALPRAWWAETLRRFGRLALPAVVLCGGMLGLGRYSSVAAAIVLPILAYGTLALTCGAIPREHRRSIFRLALAGSPWAPRGND
jgi:O-antigen/teichoic acid export membrane protein